MCTCDMCTYNANKLPKTRGGAINLNTDLNIGGSLISQSYFRIRCSFFLLPSLQVFIKHTAPIGPKLPRQMSTKVPTHSENILPTTWSFGYTRGRALPLRHTYAFHTA